MTLGNFFGYGWILAVLLVLAKLLGDSGGYFDSIVSSWPVWLVTLILVLAFARSLGPITFLEAAAAAVVWFLMQIVVDVAVTAQFLGWKVFLHPGFSLLYLFSLILVFFGHKKKYVAVRKELRAAKKS